MEEMKFEKQMSLLYITHDNNGSLHRWRSFRNVRWTHGGMGRYRWRDCEPSPPLQFQLLVSAVPDPKKFIHDQLAGNKGEIPLGHQYQQAAHLQAAVLTQWTSVKSNYRCHSPADNHFVRCYPTRKLSTVLVRGLRTLTIYPKNFRYLAIRN